MKKIQISTQHIKKIKQLQSFLSKYWRKNHILARNKNFLLWQHKQGSTLTYATAKMENKIFCIIGYIPQSHYDSKLSKKEIFLTISRAINNISPAIHLKVFRFLKEKLAKNFIGSLGAWNNRVANYNKFLGFTVGAMDHYFIASPDIKKYKVIKYNKKLTTSFKNSNYKFDEINEKFLKKNKLSNLFKKQYPIKSNIFLINRYLKHPIFKYNIFVIKKNSKSLAIVVIRKIKIGKSNVLRIIDFIGREKEFSNIGNLVVYLFKKYKSEFIDIYSYGINTKYMRLAGFLDRKKIKNLVVPDFYKPFKRKNINIMYGYISKHVNKNKIRIVKGDGDQDRPS